MPTIQHYKDALAKLRLEEPSYVTTMYDKRKRPILQYLNRSKMLTVYNTDNGIWLNEHNTSGPKVLPAWLEIA